MANLYQWYLYEDNKIIRARGRVTHHPILTDSMDITTTEVKELELLDDIVILRTLNTEYFCKYDELDITKNETFNLIKGLENKVKIYSTQEKINKKCENNTILLTFANYCEYYFKDIMAKVDDSSIKFWTNVHVGMFQDSYIISDEQWKVQLRYFPHEGHLEFYDWSVNGMEVYLVNEGDDVLYLTTPYGIIKLEPSEIKKAENGSVEKIEDIPTLSKADLYPAQMLL